EGDRRVKMQNMVRFPLMGMDMAPHVVKRSQSSWSLPSHWSPWRSEVTPISDDAVCQQTAYILFYQRRTAIPSWSANSSVAGWYLYHAV
ncbi:hypothetical protein XENOCAPTIV_008381, partial [Xenoophorus captivus]